MIKNRVYDVFSFGEEYLGGIIIFMYVGKDVIDVFSVFYFVLVYKWLFCFYIGDLVKDLCVIFLDV